MVDDRRGEGRFWATLLLAVAMLLLIALRDGVPRPADESAPADTFSAARARAMLERVLGDGGPHPLGSRDNRGVEERLLSEIRALGLEANVEESLVCNDFGSCAVVRNIVTEIEGRNAGPALLLNAHYDSVEASVGAGDDGAGVAALLETARALTAGPAPDRTIRFLFDDGEEAGLLGAEAWVARHAAEETLAVVVLEARGSSGPVLLFETNRDNLPLVRAYARAVPSPSTSSVFFSVYERLPNRTNFTVFKREGYVGMAVAFIDDPAHYHTPLNDLDHLSDGSLQHMGDLTLAMAREVSRNGLDPQVTTASYFDLLGGTVVLWPESWNIWLAVAGLILVAACGVIAVSRERASALEVLLGWLLVTILLAITAGVGWGLWVLASGRAEGSSWISNAGWLVAFAWTLGFVITSTPYAFMRRVPSILSTWTAVWLIHGIAGVVLSRLLPGAAYLFFIPAIVAGLSGIVSLVGRRPDRNEGMLVVPFVASLILVLPIVDGLYVGLGLIALPGVAVLSTLLLLPVLVVSTEARRSAMVAMAGGAMMVVFAATFLLTSVHSADTPRAVNVVAVNDDDGATSVVLLGSAESVPASLQSGADWSLQPLEFFRRRDDEQAPRFWSASLGEHAIDRIDTSGSTYVAGDQAGMLRLQGKPSTYASVIRLDLPVGAKPGRLGYGGHVVDVPPRGGRLSLRGVPPEGFLLEVLVSPGSEIGVLEERPALLRDAETIANLRSASEVPIGPGDRTIVVSRIAVDSIPSPESMEAGTDPDPS
jgi:hypothetical protein